VKVCVDVHYEPTHAIAAALLFRDWTDDSAAREVAVRVPSPRAYEPGQFYLRELPCLEAVLDPLRASLEVVIIDGYVWLDAGEGRGLGAHLHSALGERVPVIGVAKTAFRGSDFAVPILRGQSHRPLFVTAAGIPSEVAAGQVKAMHGQYRLPTLLQRVDRLARTAAPPG
jgi:deoxyribonuclease V